MRKILRPLFPLPVFFFLRLSPFRATRVSPLPFPRLPLRPSPRGQKTRDVDHYFCKYNTEGFHGVFITLVGDRFSLKFSFFSFCRCCRCCRCFSCHLFQLRYRHPPPFPLPSIAAAFCVLLLLLHPFFCLPFSRLLTK